MVKNYLWTDNPTEANVALYDPDILNECLMHLKYNSEKVTPFCINSASLDTNGNANLLSYTGNTVKFNCGNSIVPIMSSNSSSGWTLTSSHSVTASGNDIYKSLNNDKFSYCSLAHTPSLENPAFIAVEKTANFSFDYLYLKFNTTEISGDIKNFCIQNAEGDVLYSYENFEDFLGNDEFLIPIFGFNSNKCIISTTSNVNEATFVNFPCVIKFLSKSQAVSMSDAKGFNKILSEVNNLTISNSISQTLNIYIGLDGVTEVLASSLTKGIVLPSSPTTNQIHYLTATEPCLAKKYNGIAWEEYDKIPVGYAKTNSSGAISEIGTFAYNQNGYNLNTQSFTQNLASSGWTKLPNGLILQWGATAGATYAGTVTSFPIAFPNATLVVVPCTSGESGTDMWGFGLKVGGYTRSSFKVFSGASTNQGFPTVYVAIGY